MTNFVFKMTDFVLTNAGRKVFLHDVNADTQWVSFVYIYIS